MMNNKPIRRFKSSTQLLRERMQEQTMKPTMLTMGQKALLNCSRDTFIHMMMSAQLRGYSRLVDALKVYMYLKAKLEVDLIRAENGLGVTHV